MSDQASSGCRSSRRRYVAGSPWLSLLLGRCRSLSDTPWCAVLLAFCCVVLLPAVSFLPALLLLACSASCPWPAVAGPALRAYWPMLAAGVPPPWTNRTLWPCCTGGLCCAVLWRTVTRLCGRLPRPLLMTLAGRSSCQPDILRGGYGTRAAGSTRLLATR